MLQNILTVSIPQARSSKYILRLIHQLRRKPTGKKHIQRFSCPKWFGGAQSDSRISDYIVRQDPIAMVVLELRNNRLPEEAVDKALNDRLMETVGARIRARFSRGIVFEQISDHQYALAFRHKSLVDLAQQVERVLYWASWPVEIEKYCIEQSACAGIAVFPYDGTAFDVVLSKAMAALKNIELNEKYSYCRYCK